MKTNYHGGKYLRWNNRVLEVDDGDGVWKHYKHSLFATADIPNGSDGFTTAQVCLKNGYTYRFPS